MSQLTDKDYTYAPMFHSIVCRDCSKKMQGAFKQNDGSFLCAKCLINLVEKESIIFAIKKSLESVDLMLSKNRRATKKELKAHKAWLVYLIDGLKKGGNNQKYEGTKEGSKS